MGGASSGDRLPLVEAGPVAEAWVDGVEAQDLGGGSVRLFFFKERRLPGAEGPGERIVQAELVTNVARVVAIIAALAALADGFPPDFADVSLH